MVHAMPVASMACSAARWSCASRNPGCASAPITDSLTMCRTPARFAAAAAPVPYSGCRSDTGVSRKTRSAPVNAGSNVSGRSQSNSTTGTPSVCAFTGVRAPTRNGAPAACSAATTAEPTVPVAPVSKIIAVPPIPS